MYPLLETIRINNGGAQNLELHQARIISSCQTLFGASPRFSLNDYLVNTELPATGLYKCRLLYNQYDCTHEFLPYRLIIPKTFRLLNADNLDYDLKYADRTAIQCLMKQKDGADDIIMIRDGYITDCSYANLVFFSDNQAVTPAHPILKGTRRRKLLEQGEITEELIRVKDLAQFGTFKIINAMIDLGDQLAQKVSDQILT